MSNKSTQTSTKPVKSFRLRGISAGVFENESADGDLYYKVQIVRTYKDGKDFKSTPTFSRDELPIVMLVAHDAYAYVLRTERDNRADQDEK